jgi:hypothetical protein
LTKKIIYVIDIWMSRGRNGHIQFEVIIMNYVREFQKDFLSSTSKGRSSREEGIIDLAFSTEGTILRKVRDDIYFII